MDSNGYNPSILKPMCNHAGDKARHEVFNKFNREKSKKYGLWLELCNECHIKAHYQLRDENSDKSFDRVLKEQAQEQAMRHYGWTTEDFIRIFGKNYLEVNK